MKRKFYKPLFEKWVAGKKDPFIGMIDIFENPTARDLGELRTHNNDNIIRGIIPIGSNTIYMSYSDVLHQMIADTMNVKDYASVTLVFKRRIIIYDREIDRSIIEKNSYLSRVFKEFKLMYSVDYFNKYMEHLNPMVLLENLRFTDLMKNAGMSSFTQDKRDVRNDVMPGTGESRYAKLLDVEIDEVNDNVTFTFETPVTDIYPDDYQFHMTNPDNDFVLNKNPDEIYTMQFRILRFFEWLKTTPEDITNKDIEDVLEVADVQVWCSCPSMHWQGMNYILSSFDASLNPTNIAPKFWNKYHNDDNFVCKHLGGLINSIKFYIPQMRMMIKKRLGLTQK